MGPRHITTTVTMLLLCGILVLGAVLGWRSLFAEVPSDAEDAEAGSCATERLSAGQRLLSSRVRVSVFNGGTEPGLADTTLASLAKRGFKTGEVGNAPSDADVRRVQVWSTRKNDLGARLVAQQFGDEVPVKFSDEDLGPGVDVIVGNGLGRLAPVTKAIRADKAQRVCVARTRS